ncbi:MAG: hypothetical protein WC027_03235 [Candidatus Paceibacterota bacterium]
MTTVINNPGENRGDGASSGAGVVIGAIIVLLVLIIATVLALPYIRQRLATNSEPAVNNSVINVQLPGATTTVR